MSFDSRIEPNTDSGDVAGELSANVGSGFVGAFVHMGSHRSFVDIIHFVPHLLIFFMTMFIGALVGVISFSTLLYSMLASTACLIILQKILAAIAYSQESTKAVPGVPKMSKWTN
ncbi:Hypothetical protein NTJ_07637 [Nesidiocoris tenuis]|uniref:Uncharacterized protein n=1 Tax=Nesidiocoris tenuis TaxID=355587 RepID=A0ABN7ARI5_9HEMI|nr:Hypothetical protein NTJ_07637 [Nesidiocoris tenuis]